METDEQPILTLNQNYPNPVAGFTRFDFYLTRKALTRLAIHDLRGHAIAVPLAETELEAGDHTVLWQPRALPEGNYIYQLTADGVSKAKLLTLRVT